MGKNEETSSKVTTTKPKTKVVLGMLVSKLDYPVVVNYGDKDMLISPRAKMKNIDFGKLSKLPKGIFFKKNQK